MSMTLGFNLGLYQLNFIVHSQYFSPQELVVHLRQELKHGVKRGKQLANQATTIWRTLSVEPAAVRAAELEEMKANAAKYKIDDLEFGSETRVLFDELRKGIKALGEDVVELPGKITVTYRVSDFLSKSFRERGASHSSGCN
jgi:hypothetical protein